MWLRHGVKYVLQDTAGDGTGGDGGGGGGTGGEGDGTGGGADDMKETVATLTQQVTVMNKAMQLLAHGQQEGQTRMQQLMETIASGNKGDKGDGKQRSDAPLFDGVDLEQMDRSQFGTLLLSKFMERLDLHMDGKLKPVTDKIGSLESTLTTDLGRRSVADVEKSNKDLYEWKDEIGILLKETPGLALHRALAIARAENPKKAADMSKKYNSGGDGKGEQKFLSLTPTSRTGGTSDKGGKMKFNEAAEHAFDDIVASFGGTSFDQLMKH